ncbi:MAG: tetraacyldisaccharide 4'-kinase [Rubrivivax sp.]|nr:tetraacyldisaccharide 4'-kinase [Rubrivivax sp.]
MSLRTRIESAWWQPHPGALSLALAPLAGLYRLLMVLRRAAYALGLLKRHTLPVPVLVVGNLIVGGAGKTPTVIALVQALRRQGWNPGVISRGHGRRGSKPAAVVAGSLAHDVGDEPLLIARRTAAPVWVGRQRAQAGQALLAAHPQVDVLVADDGLQHLALQRDLQCIVFDRRGIGNGRLLPAGPLREALTPQPPPRSVVIYNADQPSAAWPGWVARRGLGPLRPLAAWWSGAEAAATPPEVLRGRRLIAAAGIAEPERFFTLLRAAGLSFTPMPLPDHAVLQPRPWPDDDSLVIVTEKDAVKLRPDAPDAARIVVATLDFALPEAALDALFRLLPRRPVR